MLVSRKIPALFILCVCLFSGCAGAPPDDEVIVRGETGYKLDQYLSEMAHEGFSGAVLVGKEGDIILSKGYGLADREKSIPVTPATVFDIGSITMQFTAAAILKLQMQGKLNAHNPVSNFYDILVVPEGKQVMTLHELLTHTSGVRESLGDDYEPVTRDDFVKRALLSPALQRPGKKYVYSHAGYSLLGAIVEKVSGQSYEAFLNQFLFQPAGMKHTGYVIPQWNPYDMAHGYMHRGEHWGTPLDKNWAEDGPYWNLRANGGMLSTVRDLYRWHQALKKETILSEKAKSQFYRPYVLESAAANSYCGYGWLIFTTARGTKLVVNNGGNGVFSWDFRRYLDEDIAIIMLANNADQEVSKYGRQVVGIVFGEAVQPTRTAADIMNLAELRESPMERHGLAFLNVLESGEEKMMQDFISERFTRRLLETLTPEEHLRHFLKMHEEMPGPELEDAKRTGPYGCELFIRSKQNRKHFKVVIEVEHEPPHKIEKLEFQYLE